MLAVFFDNKMRTTCQVILATYQGKILKEPYSRGPTWVVMHRRIQITAFTA